MRPNSPQNATPADTEKQPQRTNLGRLKNLIVILITLALLIWVISSISLEEVASILQTANWGFLLVAILLNLVMMSIIAYRWLRLYAVYPPPHPTYLNLLRATFVAAFFNTFLPSTMGGDAYRAIHSSREVTQQGASGAISIVFVDRIIGLIGLMVVGLLAVMLPNNVTLDVIDNLRVWVLLLTLLLMGGFLFSLQPTGYRLFFRLLDALHIPKRDWIRTKVERIQHHLGLYTSQWRLIIVALVLSVLLRTVWLLGCYVVGLTLNYDVPLLPYFIFIPIIEIARMIPLTVQGIGVREGLFGVFFVTVGLTVSEATLLGVLVYFLLNLNGIIGGLLYLVQRR